MTTAEQIRAGDEILGLTRRGSVHRVLSTAGRYVLVMTPKGWRRAVDIRGLELVLADPEARVWRVVDRHPLGPPLPSEAGP